MPSMNNKSGARGGSLAALEPVDRGAFHRPSPGWLIWGSILLVWMISLLPWRLWPLAPDLLLLVLSYWALHEPRRVGLVTAFVFGLLLDVHDAGLLGLHGLTYVLSAYGALLLHRRLQRFGAVIQALHMLPVLLGTSLLSHLLGGWLNGAWMGWDWLWSVLITIALWPVADILLMLHQRRHEAGDVGAA